MKQRISASFFRWDIVLVFICVALTVGSYFNVISAVPSFKKLYDVSQDWLVTIDERTRRRIDLSGPYHYGAAKMIVLEKTLTKEMIRQGKLIFYSKDMAVMSFYDDYEIYSSGVESRFLQTKKFYGYKWHNINIPSGATAGEPIKIILQPYEATGTITLPRVYAADDYDFSFFLIRENQLSLFFGFLILIFAIISIGYYVIMTSRNDDSRKVIAVGLFALFAFVWLTVGNPWIQFVYPHAEVLKLIAYSSSVLMILPIFWVIMRSTRFEHKKEFSYLLSAFLVPSILKLGLFLSADFDIYRFASIENMMRSAGAMYFLYLLIEDRRLNPHSDAGQLILPSLILFAAVTMGLLLTAIEWDSIGAMLPELGTLVCILLLTRQALKDLNTAQRMNHWAEHYKKIAGVDVMTGLENQDAFLQMTALLENYDMLGVITMDVNNLKEVNDELGHAEGDRMLVDLAMMIRRIFKEDYRSFRRGGDEFTIVSSGKDLEELNASTRELNKQLKEYNDNQEVRLSVAVGIALFDESRDLTLRDLLNRADENMYLRKISMKIGL